MLWTTCLHRSAQWDMARSSTEGSNTEWGLTWREGWTTAAAHKLAAKRSSFKIKVGVLYHMEKNGRLRAIPPVEKHEQLFKDLHRGTHLGFYKTLWQFMQYPLLVVRNACICQTYKCAGCENCLQCRAGHATLPSMTPIPVGGPFEKMGVDDLQQLTMVSSTWSYSWTTSQSGQRSSLWQTGRF